MLQGVHERKISIPVLTSGTGDSIVITGQPDSWIYVHELIGELDVTGTLQIKSGSTILAAFDLVAHQGLVENDEPGEDNRPRFECPPGEDFILNLSAGSIFKGAVHYSRGY